MADYDVIVIGAGLGGLSSGAILAKQNRRVLVLEQSDLIGGCCSTFTKFGYHFDVGASIVMSIGTMQKVFEKLGTKFEREVELLTCDPIYSCLFRDGSHAVYPQSIDGTADEIGRLSPPDRENFYRFVNKFQQFIDGGGEDFFTTPINTFSDMTKLFIKRPVIAKFFPFFIRTYQDVIKQYFVDERIQASMSYQSFYAGHSPDLAPGIFAILPYLEHLGMFYPRGGMIAIPQALQRIGEHYGMETRLKSLVTRIILDDYYQARGVMLSDGSIITSNVIVSDVNARSLYLDLIGERNLPRILKTGIKSYEPSLTAPMVYLGVDYKPPLAAHHTLIPLSLSEMNDAYWNKYRKGYIPDRQFGLICWPTATDPSLAPEGHHILNLIMMGPYSLKDTNWDEEKPRFIEKTIKFLSDFAIPGLSEHVKVSEMSTPLDYERQLKLPNGAIYGLQEDLPAQAVFRPASRAKFFKGLYLTGASTHPGGGVPTTMGSGLIAAEQIIKYEW